MQKSHTNFSQLVQLLDWIGSCIGIAVFVDKKLTPKMITYRVIWIVNFILFDFGLWWTVFVGKNILLSILAGTIAFATTMIIKFYYDLVIHRPTVMTFLDWCKMRHDTFEVNEFVNSIMKTRFDHAFATSMKIITVALKSMYVNETVTTFMPTILFYSMGNGLELPFPATLPGFSNGGWIKFCFNFVFQVMGILTGNFLCVLYFGTLTTIVIYLIAQLDVIIDIIKHLQGLSENQKMQIKDLYEFNQLASVVVDLHNDVVKYEHYFQFNFNNTKIFDRLFKELIDFTSKVFLWIELDCVGGVLLIWFIFFVEKSHQGIAIGANILIIFSFGTCYLNELILDKVSYKTLFFTILLIFF